jgi:hypothetical protein
MKGSGHLAGGACRCWWPLLVAGAWIVFDRPSSSRALSAQAGALAAGPAAMGLASRRDAIRWLCSAPAITSLDVHVHGVGAAAAELWLEHMHAVVAVGQPKA